MFTALSDEIRPLKFKFSSSRSCTPPPPECLFDNIAAPTAAVTAPRAVSQQLKVLRLQCHAASLSPSQSLHPPSCRDSGTVNAANEAAKISISLARQVSPSAQNSHSRRVDALKISVLLRTAGRGLVAGKALLVCSVTLRAKSSLIRTFSLRELSCEALRCVNTQAHRQQTVRLTKRLGGCGLSTCL